MITGPVLLETSMHPMQNKSPEERRAIAAKSHATRRARAEAMAVARKEAKVYAGGLREEIASLETRLAALRRMEAMNTRSVALTGKALLRAEEIAAAARPWQTETGVYFLLDGTEVVYVGQAVNIYARIAQHSDKQFDRYAFVPCPREMLDKLESLYIHCLRPPLNGNQVDGAKCAPLSIEALIGPLPR